MVDPIALSSTVLEVIEFIPNFSRKLVKWHHELGETSISLEELVSDVSEAQNIFSAALASSSPASSNELNPSKELFRNAVDKLDRISQKCTQLKAHHVKLRYRLFPSIIKQSMMDLRVELETLNSTVLSFFDLMKPQLASSRQPGFQVVFCVPKNPIYTVIDFDRHVMRKSETFEAQLRDKVFSFSSEGAIGAVAAKGMGGVGKTVAMRAVALREEAKQRFPGGIFFVEIGAEAGYEKLKSCVAWIVNMAGGKDKADEIRREVDFSLAVQIAAQWFEHSPCLFIFDDVWCLNGITSRRLEVLSSLAKNRMSRIALTTRDLNVNRFCSDAVAFEPLEESGDQSVKILLKCAGVATHPTNPEAFSAFQDILKHCHGLPLALALAGSAVKSIAGKCAGGYNDCWKDYSARLTSVRAAEGGGTVKGEISEKLKFSLRLISIDVERTGHLADIDMKSLFLSFSVFRKKQAIPHHILARLWNVQETVVEDVLGYFERFSLLQTTFLFAGSKKIIFVSVHDLFLDSVRDWCGNDGVAEWSLKLVSSYITENSGTVLNDQFELKYNVFIDLDDDDYLFVNLCGLLRQARQWGIIIELYQDPRWILKQMTKNGHDQVRIDIALCEDLVEECDVFADESRRASFLSFLRALDRAVISMIKSVGSSQWEGMFWFQLYGRLLKLSQTNEDTFKFLEAVKLFSPKPWVKPSLGVLAASESPEIHMIRSAVGNEYLRFQKRFGNSLCVCCFCYYEFTLVSYDWDTAKEEGSETYDFFSSHISEAICGCFISPDSFVLGMRSGAVVVFQRNPDCFFPVGERSVENSCRTFNSKATVSRNDEFRCSRILARLKKKSPFSDGLKKISLSIKRGLFGLLDRKIEPNQSVPYIDEGNRFSVHERSDGYISSRGRSRFTSSLSSTWQRSRTSLRSTSNTSLRIAEFEGGKVTVRTDGHWKLTKLKRHNRIVRSVAVSANGLRIVSGSHDKKVFLWEEVDSEWKSCILYGPTDRVNCVDITADGCAIVSGSADGTIHVWKENDFGWDHHTLYGFKKMCTDFSQKDVPNVRRHPSSEDLGGSSVPYDVREVSISENGDRIASIVGGCFIFISDDVGNGWQARFLELDGVVFITCVALSNIGRRLACGSSSSQVHVWDEIGGAWEYRSLVGHEESVRSLAITEDGSHIISWSEDGSLRVWDDGLREFSAGDDAKLRENLMDVSACADGTCVVTLSRPGTDYFYFQRWKPGVMEWQKSSILQHLSRITSFAFSGNGNRVVLCDEESVRLIDLQTTNNIWAQSIVSEHSKKGVPSCISTSFDGSLVACAIPSKTVHLWSELDGVCVRSFLNGHDDNVICVSVSTDGLRIVTGSKDGTTRLWTRCGENWKYEILVSHSRSRTLMSSSRSGGRSDLDLISQESVSDLESEQNDDVNPILREGSEAAKKDASFNASGSISHSGSQKGGRSETENCDKESSLFDDSKHELSESGTFRESHGISRADGEDSSLQCPSVNNSCNDSDRTGKESQNSGWHSFVLQKETISNVAISKSGRRIASYSRDNVMRTWHEIDGVWCLKIEEIMYCCILHLSFSEFNENMLFVKTSRNSMSVFEEISATSSESSTSQQDVFKASCKLHNVSYSCDDILVMGENANALYKNIDVRVWKELLNDQFVGVQSMLYSTSTGLFVILDYAPYAAQLDVLA